MKSHYLVNGRQKKREQGRVRPRSDVRIMGIVNVSGVPVRVSGCDVLGMMNVHREIVAPYVSVSHGRNVENARGQCERENNKEM